MKSTTTQCPPALRNAYAIPWTGSVAGPPHAPRIKDNLWKEAGLSRATMNRAVQILAEWDSRVAECGGFTPLEARKNDELATLRKKLADKIRECTELHHRLDAAATAIAALHHDNVLLRQDLNARGQLIALQVHR